MYFLIRSIKPNAFRKSLVLTLKKSRVFMNLLFIYVDSGADAFSSRWDFNFVFLLVRNDLKIEVDRILRVSKRAIKLVLELCLPYRLRVMAATLFRTLKVCFCFRQKEKNSNHQFVNCFIFFRNLSEFFCPKHQTLYFSTKQCRNYSS